MYQMQQICQYHMMTSSNGNIFRVTGHLFGEFPAQRPVTQSFDGSFDMHQNKRLSKQSRGWWFETPLWCHSNDGNMRRVRTKNYEQGSQFAMFVVIWGSFY